MKLGLIGMLVAGTVAPATPQAAAGSAPVRVMWQVPRPMTKADWTCGPGGCDRTPRPPFRFVKEDTSGTNPKISVEDSRGLKWDLKFGAEVIPECFAPRFLEALGYVGEPTYCLGNKIEGATRLGRAGRFLGPDGNFKLARFELRGESDLVFLAGDVWAWDNNPFLGSHQLAGLKIAMMLLSNWDDKDSRDFGDSNNGVFRKSEAGQPVEVYTVFDWGASLGRWGHVMRRDQGDCAGFTLDTPDFVKEPTSGQLEWGYVGKHPDVAMGITVDDVRWLLPYLTRITGADLRTGFQSAGATSRQAGCWATALRNRIRQLEAVSR